MHLCIARHETAQPTGEGINWSFHLKRCRVSNGAVLLGVQKMILRSLVTAAGLSLLAGTAFAADLTMPAGEVPVVDNGFDWARPYVGASVSSEFSLDDGDDYFGGGVFAGINFLASESFLLGVQVTADAVSDGDASYGELFVLGRAGILLTPDMLLYGIGGVGFDWELDDPDNNSTAYQLGAGIEVAVSDSVTVRGQLTGYGYFDDSDLFDYARATVGVAFHF